jgi:hypothetical protein
MTWASRRRAFVIGIIALIVIGIAAVATAFLVGKEPVPTCMDGVMNQDEEGVDCGGSCAYLCAADVAPPSVSFVRAVPSGSRTDVIAYVANRNAQAAVRGARYTVELYGADRGFIASKEGVIDLPPGSAVPVFVPGLAEGVVAGQAFLAFDDASLAWYRETRTASAPRVEEARVEEGSAPRATALVRNPSATPMDDIALVATVFDAAGTPIAASQTLLRGLAPGGSAVATFFWNEPFSAPAGRIEIKPVPWLP